MSGAAREYIKPHQIGFYLRQGSSITAFKLSPKFCINPESRKNTGISHDRSFSFLTFSILNCVNAIILLRSECNNMQRTKII